MIVLAGRSGFSIACRPWGSWYAAFLLDYASEAGEPWERAVARYCGRLHHG